MGENEIIIDGWKWWNGSRMDYENDEMNCENKMDDLWKW